MTRFVSKFKKLSRRNQQMLGGVIAVALVGSILLQLSHALTPHVSVEPESGTVGNGASVTNDSTASGGHGVIFGGSTRTAGAISVLDSKYGITDSADTTPDATAAFSQAMTDALASPVRYPSGPGGAPQAVVYVPAGSYRLLKLTFQSNVRLEIDAGAVLEPVQESSPPNGTSPTSMIVIGSGDKTSQTQNVTMIGVGSATSSLKQRASPTYDGWDISHYFTVDLDAADSGGWNDLSLSTMINVKGFLLQNIYAIQNDTIPDCSSKQDGCEKDSRGPYPSPTSSRAVLVYRPSDQDGTTTAGPFYDPTNGSVINMYTVHSPYGFGPTQITAGHNLVFQNLYSQGGTTLRLETDASLGKTFKGELKGLTATHIVGVNCNRPVSFAAHMQLNSDVHISDVTALSCQNGSVQSSENAHNSGHFTNSTVDHLTAVGGMLAQLPVQNSGGNWVVGESDRAFNVHPDDLDWSVNYTNFSCSGPFVTKPDRITINGVADTQATCQ